MSVQEPLENVDGSMLWNITLIPRHWTTSLGAYEVTDTEEWLWLGEGKWGYYDPYEMAINGGIWAPCLEPRPLRFILTNPLEIPFGWDYLFDGEQTRREALLAGLEVLSELACGFEEIVELGSEDLEVALWPGFECPDKEVTWQQDPPWYSVTQWAFVGVGSYNPGLIGPLGKEVFYQALAMGNNSHGGIYTANEPGPLQISDIVSTQIMFHFIRRCHYGDAHNNLVYMVYP